MLAGADVDDLVSGGGAAGGRDGDNGPRGRSDGGGHERERDPGLAFDALDAAIDFHLPGHVARDERAGVGDAVMGERGREDGGEVFGDLFAKSGKGGGGEGHDLPGMSKPETKPPPGFPGGGPK